MKTLLLLLVVAVAQPTLAQTLVRFDPAPAAFPIANAPIVLDPQASDTLRTVSAAFASDLERVTSHKPAILSAPPKENFILVGVLGQSPLLDTLVKAGKLDLAAIAGQWEAALTTVVDNPFPGVSQALVIAGSDRRGASFALFTLSRQMGVSPWNWWADVPVPHHDAVFVTAANAVQPPPSVQYRGIFINDEDWGMRPWAAKKMDNGNFGPNTYGHIFELLLRLHANTLWPAMHPGSLAFNANADNARLADKWAIVMGSSHSEALLRNNVGEWDEKRDGPWNYQKNASAMQAYWDKRLAQNGRYENFYTVGLRGVHDSGLEATGTPQVKAALVEQVMTDQRAILAKHLSPDLAKVPQVIWLYKESLDLYRVGMKVPDDVTLGWTDDNYGYIRQLPDAEEQKRPGGSGLYYHVSYWGSPHDYLWLCTTPPSLIREEMTKAYDHGVRRYWILNVGDLKPAELDIDYFMQLAVDEPAVSKLEQSAFLKQWFAEQFPTADAAKIADLMTRYYALNFIRKPEFMGFNGYNDGVNRSAFNPLAWGNENQLQALAWSNLAGEESLFSTLHMTQGNDLEDPAYFELISYPIQAAAAQNFKVLAADRTYLDAAQHNLDQLKTDAKLAQAAYDRIQQLTSRYNAIFNGKWSGMMSANPRDRHVFEMPALATAADATKPLPTAWAAGDEASVISLNAARFTSKSGDWRILNDLGISGRSVVFGDPGKLANRPPTTGSAPWLEYTFATTTAGDATLQLHLLPTFPVDSEHRLRYAVALDQQPSIQLDATADTSARNWPSHVLGNDDVVSIPLPGLAAGPHTLRFLYRDPGVILQHLVIAFPNTPPAYPVPPETSR